MEPLATTPSPDAPALPGRPFSAGEVIGRSFTVWLRSFVPFSIVTLVVNVPVFLLVAFAPDEGGNAERFVSALADLVVVGALTYGVLQSLDGGRVSLGALFGKGFARWSAVARTSIAFGLAVLVGLALLVVPGVMAYCALYVAIPAVVVEDVGAIEALQRSRMLTKGSRWGILAIGLVVLAVTVVVAGGVVAFAMLAAQGLPERATALIGTAVGALVTPLGACASAVAYHDLRVAKEGVDTAALVKVFE